MPSPSCASYFAMVTADAARIMIVAMDMAMDITVVRQTGIPDLFEVPQYTLQERFVPPPQILAHPCPCPVLLSHLLPVP